MFDAAATGVVARYRDEDWLRRRYWDEGATQSEMAEECAVSPRTIRTYMQRFDIPTRDIEGENHPLHGEERAESVKERISDTLEGREFSEEWRQRISEAQRGSELPPEVRERISESLSGHTRSKDTREKMSESTTGDENPMWKGGHPGYRQGWKQVCRRARERDEVCQHCGHDGAERQLEVHHIIPLRKFDQANDAELSDADDLSNLVTLCRRCHQLAEEGEITFESELEDPTK